MEKNKELIIFIPSIEDGGVEKNLYIILNYLSKKRKNLLTLGLISLTLEEGIPNIFYV